MRKYKILSILILLLSAFSIRAMAQHEKSAYVIEIKQDIDKSSAHKLRLGLEKAREMDADFVILHLNTYGGAVDAADSMRAMIMNFPRPVVSFIDIQACSAGALISIACDSIYMNHGSTFGAATVVNASGEVMPDKYQAFMRAMMRSTAESHGQKGGKWRRDPDIAQRMVGVDSVLSFTPSEAIEAGYCEGMAESVEEVASSLGVSKKNIHKMDLSVIEMIILFLMSPFLQSIFIMMIFMGIYWEFKTPGIGFPTVVAVAGALLYFAPLYIEGLAMNWEIVLFFAGLILIGVEIFVIPGFGVAGITGIIAVISALVFAMVDNEVLYRGDSLDLIPLIRPFARVFFSFIAALALSLWLFAKFIPTGRIPHIAQNESMDVDKGYVGVEVSELDSLVGQVVVAATDMKPSGKILVGNRQYEAAMEVGFASKGDNVRVTRNEGGRLYCLSESSSII